MLKEGMDGAESLSSSGHRQIVWTQIKGNILTWDQGEQHDIKRVGYAYQQDPLCLLKALLFPERSFSFMFRYCIFKTNILERMFAIEVSCLALFEGSDFLLHHLGYLQH